jgi:hypothetical protein
MANAFVSAAAAWRPQLALDRRRALLLALSCLGSLALPACTPGGHGIFGLSKSASGVAPSLKLPPRRADAETGSAFFARAQRTSLQDFEAAAVAAIEAGNVPPFLRELVPLEVEGDGPQGRVRATLHVAPDYLAIGSDEDFVRVPLRPATAQRLCDLAGCSLPTPKIVDDIYRAARVKLRPLAMSTPSGAMVDRADFMGHQKAVEEERARRSSKLGELTAGVGKDIVLAKALQDHPDKVLIYGWHQEDGTPIQALSWIHDKAYVDYSHGTRLVAESMEIDGKPARVADVLRDPALCVALSNEGPLEVTAYPT